MAPPAPPAKVSYGEFPIPTEWGISGKDYYADASRVVKHMQYATQMEKGTANMDLINKNMKKEMTDFVSFYRRFNNVSGKQSFSTLYTAINVLAGHYTSYGTKFPVPDKRRKRLYQVRQNHPSLNMCDLPARTLTPIPCVPCGRSMLRSRRTSKRAAKRIHEWARTKVQ